MTLRARTWLYLTVATAGLILAGYAVAVQVVLASYEAIETSLLLREVSRVEKLLQAREASLVSTARDYSHWTDTWTWLGGDLPGFPDENLTAQSLASQGVDVALAVDNGGQMAWSRAIEDGVLREAPAGLLGLLAQDARALEPRIPAEPQHGLVRLPEGTLILASSPVLQSDGSGPTRGLLVFGCWLEPTLLAQLSQTMELELEARAPAPHEPLGPRVEPERDDDWMYGATVLPGIDGRPAVGLRLKFPREVYGQARATAALLLFGVLVAGGSFGAVMLLLVEWVVLRRVLALTRTTRNIARTSDPHLRVPVDGADELAELGQSINDMLANLGRTRDELAEARDRAEEASRVKSTFLSNMSHELRTPLNAILGYSELLAEVSDPDAQQDLAHIRAAGRHLLALIDDLLDIARIEAGRMPLSEEAVDLGALTTALVAEIRPLAERNGNQITVVLPSLVPELHTDALRVRQIVLNLLSNACKFTRGGRITVSVREHHEWVCIEVADTGPGIAPEQLARLFQPFVQANGAVVRQHGGTGLGLALTRHLCDLLGGKITAASQLGRGATFTVTLPRRRRVQGQPPMAAAS